jgi:hypothetical protein
VATQHSPDFPPSGIVLTGPERDHGVTAVRRVRDSASGGGLNGLGHLKLSLGTVAGPVSSPSYNTFTRCSFGGRRGLRAQGFFVPPLLNATRRSALPGQTARPRRKQHTLARPCGSACGPGPGRWKNGTHAQAPSDPTSMESVGHHRIVGANVGRIVRPQAGRLRGGGTRRPFRSPGDGRRAGAA